MSNYRLNKSAGASAPITKQRENEMKHGTLISMTLQEIAAEYVRFESLIQKNKKYRFRRSAVSGFAQTQMILQDEYQRRLLIDPSIGPIVGN